MKIPENTGAETQEKRLIPYRKKDKWGYVDYATKEIVIPCTYDYILWFRYGRAKVMLQNKYGVIDMNGQEILPVIYDESPKLYEEGIYLDEKTDKTCFDLNGKVLIPLSNYNKHFISFFFEHASNKEKRHLFFDNDDKLKISRKYLGINEHGISIVGCTWVTEKGKVFRLPESCDFRGRFLEGLVCVMDFNTLRYGFMNPAKEFVIPLELEVDDLTQCAWGWEGGFYDGLTMTRKHGKIGFINKQNELIIPRIYDDYDDGYDFNNRFCIIQKDTQWGVIDKQGKTIIPFKYDEECIKLWSERRWIIFYNDKYSVLNEEAQIIVPDDKYDDIMLMFHGENEGYSREFARVCKNGLYGFIDEQGNEKIPLIYNEASAMQYNLIKVKKDGYYGIIDKNGNVVIPLKYPDGISIEDGEFFRTDAGWVDISGFEYWED